MILFESTNQIILVTVIDYQEDRVGIIITKLQINTLAIKCNNILNIVIMVLINNLFMLKQLLQNIRPVLLF